MFVRTNLPNGFTHAVTNMCRRTVYMCSMHRSKAKRKILITSSACTSPDTHSLDFRPIYMFCMQHIHISLGVNDGECGLYFRAYLGEGDNSNNIFEKFCTLRYDFSRIY